MRLRPASDYVIAVEPPQADVLTTLGNGLQAPGQLASGIPTGAHESMVTARDALGAVLGGAWCFFSNRVLFIHWLWVDEKSRGGTGSAIMDMAEQEAVNRGGKAVFLDTFSPAAKSFYERRGFETYGIFNYAGSDIRRYSLQKQLKRLEGPSNQASMRETALT